MTPKIKTPSAFTLKLNELAVRSTPIKFTEKIFFISNLRTMIKAGLSLIEALSIIEKETVNKKLKKITLEIQEQVEKGQPLSDILGKYPKVFPNMYVSMIAAGEISGKMEEALTQVVIQMKKTQELTSSVRGAMIYPSVIITAMIGVGILMTTVILPKLLEIFKDFDAELPLPTKILIAFVDFFSNPITLILLAIVLVGGITTFLYFLHHSSAFRFTVHTIMLHMPIFGKIIKKINIAKFSLTLSSLLQSAIPIIDALHITGDACTNVCYTNALHSASVEIKTGSALSEILRKSPHLFPPMVTEMIMVGERSGEAENLLRELAEFFNEEITNTMKNFATIIEPVIILILGVAVAGIALAVMMPMFSLVQNF